MPPLPLDPETQQLIIKETARAVEGLLKPRQIVKIAKAEREASVIKTKGEIEVAELRQAAYYRLQENAVREEQNLKRIEAQAQLLLPEGATTENVDDDWLANYIDKARLVSNERMQSLWARVLAGEVDASGSFSRRTLNAINDLESDDCALFTELCRFAFQFDDYGYVPVIIDVENAIFAQHGITTARLGHLESIGLIRLSPPTEQHKLPNMTELYANYFERRYCLRLSPGTPPLQLPYGQVALTQVGQELAHISGATPLDTYVEYMLLLWKHLIHEVPATGT